MTQDQWLKNVIKKIILEDTEKKKKAKSGGSGSKVYYVAGAVGKGRVSDQIKSMKALSQSDPSKLMKNLGVNNPQGDDLEKIQSILSDAFSNDETMKSVYSISNQRPVRTRAGESKGYEIGISIIKPRDGLNYILHTLLGAERAFSLKFSGDVEVDRIDNKIMVYVNE